MVLENGADDAVPPTHPKEVFAAAKMDDRIYRRVENATHYYKDQPRELDEAVKVAHEWISAR